MNDLRIILDVGLINGLILAWAFVALAIASGFPFSRRDGGGLVPLAPRCTLAAASRLADRGGLLGRRAGAAPGALMPC